MKSTSIHHDKDASRSFVALATALLVLCVGFLEGVGWIVLEQFRGAIGESGSLQSVPVYELPAYALPAYASAPAELVGFALVGCLLCYLWVMATYAAQTSPRYFSIVVNRRKSTDTRWYHFTKGFDYSGMGHAARGFYIFMTIAYLLIFGLFSVFVARSYGTRLATQLQAGIAPPAWLQVPKRESIHFGFTPAAARSLPKEVLNANNASNLTLLDDINDTYKVGVIKKGFDPNTHQYSIDHAQTIYNKQSFSIMPARQPHPVMPKPTDKSSTITVNALLIVLGIVGVGFAVKVSVAQADQRRKQIGICRPFDPSQIAKLDLPSSDERALYKALRAGQDVNVRIVDEEGEREIFLPSSAFTGIELVLMTREDWSNSA